MFANYFKVALRNLVKYRFSSLINVLGLSLSMSVGLIVILLLSDLYRYDEFNVKKDSIYRITTNFETIFGSSEMACSPVPLAESLLDDYPQVLKMVKFEKLGGVIDVNGKKLNADGLYASKDFFELFSYDLSDGIKTTALEEAYSVVITAKLAKKVFGNDNPIHKILKIENLGNFKVTAVIREEKYLSHLQFDFLLSYKTFEILSRTQKDETVANGNNNMQHYSQARWESFNTSYSYLLLDERTDLPKLLHYMNTAYSGHYAHMKKIHFSFGLQALIKICPGPVIANQIGFSFPVKMAVLFIVISIVILVLASFNYTNLTLARSLTRAKEVGIRKVLGANKGSIIIQYVIEAVIISFIALLLAVCLANIVIPQLLGIDPMLAELFGLTFSYSSVVISIAFTLLAGLISGLIPSLYMSNVKAVKVLKGLIRVKLIGGMNLRKILIGLQFLFTILFVIIAVLLARQITDIKSTDLGFDTENRMLVNLQGLDYNVVTNALKGNPNVVNVSASSGVPVLGGNWVKSKVKKNATEGEELIYRYSVTPDFIPNMKMNLLHGRNFDLSDADGSTRKIIVNQSFVHFFGFPSSTDAIGEKVIVNGVESQIIGIVQDFFIRTTLEKIEPIVLLFDPDQMAHLLIKYHPGVNKKAFAGEMEKAWGKLDQSRSFSFQYLDESSDFNNRMYNYILSVVAYIALLAISIACFGLMGMMAFNTQSRIKEIGIRKVFGINRMRLLVLLAKDYFIIISLSSLVSLIIIWFVSQEVLKYLPNSIGFDLLSIILGLSLTVLIAFLSIFSQIFIAEKSNTLKALQNQ